MATLKTSEFWSAIVAAVLGVLVNQQLITAEMASYATQISAGLIAYIIGRTAHKLANGIVPFTPGPK